jgi:hypothetical protein
MSRHRSSMILKEYEYLQLNPLHLVFSLLTHLDRHSIQNILQLVPVLLQRNSNLTEFQSFCVQARRVSRSINSC